MLLEKSTRVYSDLVNHTGLTSLLTNGDQGISPILAPEDEGAKFVTYFVRYARGLTKGGISEFQVRVLSWAETHDESIAIADQVEAAFGASDNFYEYVSGQAVFNEQKEIYTEQIFNLKN